jgi:hypothetical protein
MAPQASETRECPFCKEEVKATALRCKHCLSDIVPTKPDHGGVCPFCKETINPDAIGCPHCKANLSPGLRGSLEREPRALRRVARRPMAAPATRATRRVTQPRADLRQPARARDNDVWCAGCFEVGTDEDGTWDLIGCTEDECVYELRPTSPYVVFE